MNKSAIFYAKINHPPERLPEKTMKTLQRAKQKMAAGLESFVDSLTPV